MQVVFAVHDVTRSLAFYEQAFGWPRNTRIDYEDYVELHPAEGDTLGLFERAGYDELVGAPPVEAADGRVAPAYLYLRVPDAKEAAEQIEAAGGRLLSALSPHSWGETAAWFADPDGNVIAVSERS